MGDSGNRRELIKVFYHVMGDGRFLTILEYISKEIGYGDEYARFVFAIIIGKSGKRIILGKKGFAIT